MLNSSVAINGQTRFTGWLRPMPDLRDYTAEQEEIAALTRKLNFAKGAKTAPMAKADLRPWCSPIEDQGKIGSCTAHAVVGVVEYFQQRAFGKYIDGSRLFTYKATRNLMAAKGDVGGWLRSAMGSAVLCGIAPEKYWPYTDKAPDWDNEPTAFVYSIADRFSTVKYFCHDPQNMAKRPADVLASVKKFAAAGIPSVMGFYIFPSFEDSNAPGAIAFPGKNEKSEGGHAVAVVGFDDRKKIKNTKSQDETIGALLIRNSWGKAWGEDGYGWLPYRYVLEGLALDFWSCLSMEWVDTEQFGF